MLTASTMGWLSVWSTALIEQVPTVSRWNRSRGVPSDAASAALMVSACETHTIVPSGWAATRSATWPVMRACISANDSPPGNRNWDGWRCTVRQAFNL